MQNYTENHNIYALIAAPIMVLLLVAGLSFVPGIATHDIIMMMFAGEAMALLCFAEIGIICRGC
jgi:hypothetical protein